MKTYELLAEINNLKQVKRDSNSPVCYAKTISIFVNDKKNNGCTLLEASEVPFFMSELLSKLNPRDNTHYGREMERAGKDENVSNLITWLHQEGTFHSRGKQDNDNAEEKECTHRGPTFRRTQNHAANNDRTPNQEACPLSCTSKHGAPVGCLSAVSKFNCKSKMGRSQINRAKDATNVLDHTSHKQLQEARRYNLR